MWKKIRPRASKANITRDGLSYCESDYTKDIEEEEKDEEILQGDFMEESETAENEHAVPKTFISVTKDKQKKNFRKRRFFKGEPETDTDLKSMKKMVANIKKPKESFKPSDVEPQPIITSSHPFSPTSFPQNDVLASRHASGFRSTGCPQSSDSNI